MDTDVTVFALAASLRRQSLNEKLLHRAVVPLDKQLGCRIHPAKLNEYPLPLYNADVQRDEGFPEASERLRAAIEEADAMVLATPEYNHSIPGGLKNAIDWVSRYRPNPLEGCHVLLLAAANSRVGGLRGLRQTRVPLEALGAHVYPRMYGLSGAREAFDADGQFVDDERDAELEALLRRFIDHVRRCQQGGGANDE